MAIAIPQSLNCRLPYSTNAGNGFITFPGGAWIADPRGAMHKDGSYEITDTSPTVRGTSVFWSGTSAYDAAINRWLPVRREQVSPDGHAYAYLEEDDQSGGRFFHLHRVTMPDGRDTVLLSGRIDAILGWNSLGIILTSTPGEGLGGPLTVVDPATGASRQLSGTRGFEVLDDNITWSDEGYVMPSHIFRQDLVNGSVQTWFDFSSQGELSLMGLDASGHPIITVEPGVGAAQGSFQGPPQTWVMTTPTKPLPIGLIPRGDIGLTDSHGTWLGADDGLYFLDLQDRLWRVSDLGGNAAGPCL